MPVTQEQPASEVDRCEHCQPQQRRCEDGCEYIWRVGEAFADEHRDSKSAAAIEPACYKLSDDGANYCQTCCDPKAGDDVWHCPWKPELPKTRSGSRAVKPKQISKRRVSREQAGKRVRDDRKDRGDECG